MAQAAFDAAKSGMDTIKDALNQVSKRQAPRPRRRSSRSSADRDHQESTGRRRHQVIDAATEATNAAQDDAKKALSAAQGAADSVVQIAQQAFQHMLDGSTR